MDKIFRCFDGPNAEEINNQIANYCEDNKLVEFDRSEPVVVVREEFNQFMVRSKLRPMDWGELQDWKARHYTPIKELGLSRRAHEVLFRNVLLYAEEIVELDRESLLSLRNMGEKTLEEIYKALKEKGFDI